MSAIAQNEPMTRFLMYKVAIRAGEADLAAENLHIISTTSKNDPTLLYACCLDARDADNKTMLLAALQLVLERYDYGAPSLIHLPSLLRLTIRLTEPLLDESEDIKDLSAAEAIIEKLCKLFEGGLISSVSALIITNLCIAAISVRKASSAHEGTEIVWTVPELDWYSKYSYNLAISHISNWPPQYTLRMLICCVAFIDHYPEDINAQMAEDLTLRKLFCEFSAGTALVVLARGEDNIEKQLQCYLDLRKHVHNFDTLIEGKVGSMEVEPAQDLLQKLAILLAFDFEAACQLKAWDDLSSVILKADLCKSLRAYELMADCILSARPPTQGVPCKTCFRLCHN